MSEVCCYADERFYLKAQILMSFTIIIPCFRSIRIKVRIAAFKILIECLMHLNHITDKSCVLSIRDIVYLFDISEKLRHDNAAENRYDTDTYDQFYKCESFEIFSEFPVIHFIQHNYAPKK